MLRACTRVGAGVGVVGAGGRRQGGALMASLVLFLPSSPYSSSHLPPKPQPQPPPPPTPPTPVPAAARPSRLRALFARAAARRDPEPSPAAPAEAAPAAAVEERRSLAVRTGELFLGLAALLLRGTGATRGGGAAVEEVEKRDGVVWEQRPEDVEAERRRRELTSPGFSFSAAGLLFPYHLGAAQYLMDKGYITAVLRDVLDKFLPDDLHIRCNGRIRASRLGLQEIGISPDCNPENRATPRQLFNWALEPAEDEVLDKLYELGYKDAAVWAEQNSAEFIVKNGQPLGID
nr:unnamed protein product [Digitaria exilis]